MSYAALTESSSLYEENFVNAESIVSPPPF